jgi:hypothetical protein
VPNGGQINLTDASQVATPNLMFARVSVDNLPMSDSQASGTGDVASGTASANLAALLPEVSAGTGELLDGVLPPTAAGHPNLVAALAPEIEIPVARIAMASTSSAQSSVAAPAQLGTPDLVMADASTQQVRSNPSVPHQTATPRKARMSEPGQLAQSVDTVPVVVATSATEPSATSPAPSAQTASTDAGSARDVVQVTGPKSVVTAGTASGNSSGGSLPGPLGLASAALALLGMAAWSRKAKLPGSGAARAAGTAAEGSNAAAGGTDLGNRDKPQA